MTEYWNNLCAFLPSIPMPPNPPQPDFQGLGAQQVNLIAHLAGWPVRINVFTQPGVQNAMATGNTPWFGDEVVIYDPIFMEGLRQRYGPSAPFGVLAHEVGHIVRGVLVPGWMPDWSDEMRADHFAGFVLARHGLDLQPLQRCIMELMARPGYRHPDGRTRTAVVRGGYIEGGGIA